MKSVSHRAWSFLRMRILTLDRFDSFLQGALVIVLLLETNAYLLLRRDAGAGKVTSYMEEYVRLGSLLFECLLGTVAAWLGRRRRQFTLAGWFAGVAALGLLVLAVPFANTDIPVVELCGTGYISGYSESRYTEYTAESWPTSQDTADTTEPWLIPRTVLLVLTAALCSITRLIIWSHGFTYLDDHEPKNGSFYYGVLISIRLSLGLAGIAWLQPGARSDTWWYAQLSLAMLMLMYVGLFCLFPTDQVDVFDDSGFLEALSSVLKNKFLIVQGVAMGLLHAGLFNYIYYDNSYIQAIFHIEVYREDPRSSRTVSNLFRPFVVIFFIMIFRIRFSQRRADGVKVGTAARVGAVLSLIAAATVAILAALHCQTSGLVGVDELESGSGYVQPLCSEDCGCSSHKYGFSPVCGVDAGGVYFSPCNAGCSQYETLNGFIVFENCTCGEQRFVRGSCSQLDCASTYEWYQVLFTLHLAIGGSALLMQGMAVARSVASAHKPLALGVSFSIVALVTAAGHGLYMLLSSLFCVFAVDASCALHSASLRALPIVSAVLAVVSAIISLVNSRNPVPTESTVL